jgi:hypothetical protein
MKPFILLCLLLQSCLYLKPIKETKVKIDSVDLIYDPFLDEKITVYYNTIIIKNKLYYMAIFERSGKRQANDSITIKKSFLNVKILKDEH